MLTFHHPDSTGQNPGKGIAYKSGKPILAKSKEKALNLIRLLKERGKVFFVVGPNGNFKKFGEPKEKPYFKTLQALWKPERITTVKQNILQELGPNPVAHSLWANEPYGWIDNPKTDQDLLYNKILYEGFGSDTNSPQVRVPATEWLIHYTTKDFSSFDLARKFKDDLRGQMLAGGHASYTIQLDCQKPLSEIDYGLQFAWSTSHMIYDMHYGDTIWNKKMRLFRSDSAVQHQGDKGEVIFRACSEQDLMSFTFKGTIGRGYGIWTHSGVWVSDETGESFESPLELVKWADARVGIKRIWPLPIPGFFTSVGEVRIWAERMKLCSWSVFLKRSLKSDLEKLESLSSIDAIAYFNQNYRSFSFLEGR